MTSFSSSSVGYSTDDEDSSTSSRHRKHDKGFPSKASDWTPDHMKELRVKYDESVTDLRQFMSGLKKQRDIEFFGLSEMPSISYKLLQFTKDSWTFSFDFDKDAGLCEGMNRARESILELDIKKSDKEKEVQEIDDKYKSLFCGWRLSLLEFWKYFSTLLARFGKPRQREGRFTQLFMAFSKIFFLTPETGEAYSECLVIKDRAVHGIPNVRFMTFPYFPPAEKILKLIIVTEVKQYNDAFRGQYNSETFTFKNISKRVLGQHGIKLLMEREGSFFYPYVVGLLCIGTKIIFTCLHIDEAHFQRITNRGEVDETMESTISYTRPFDYMDVNDREEIMESFFWFGFLQSNAYRFI